MARATGGRRDRAEAGSAAGYLSGHPETVESTRLKHLLEVVRVADHLLRPDTQARWLTERQLQHAQVCDRCAANRRAWRRRPDGVLLSGSHEVAIEVETTTKPLE